MNATAQKNDRMLTAAPPRLVLSLSLPATAALLVSAACGILDAWFISRLGNAAGGAVGIAFAVMALIQAIGYTLGTGAGSLISRALGAGDRNGAGFFASLAFYLSLALGGLVALGGLCFTGPIIRFLGASEGIYPYARAYAVFLFPAAPLMCGVFVLNNLLRAEGQVRFAMLGTVAGNLVNVALDPLLLFRAEMGIGGAALALLISQAVSFLLLLGRYLCGKTRVSLRPRKGERPMRQLLSLLAIGSPSLFRQGLAGVASALLLRRAREWGDATAAAVSVNARVFLLLYSFCLGVGQGLMPAAGFNKGANRPDRVKKLFGTLLLSEAILGAVALLIVECFPTALIGIFGAKNESVYYTEFAVKAFRIYLCMMVLACVNKATFIFLQAMGKAVESTMLSMVREIVFGVGLALLLPLFFGLDGVLWSMPAADILTAILSAVIILKTVRQLNRQIGEQI
ncbi:MAG TPA: MATE family efflux transporter [Clostridiales bacterium]|nr:MATE family efflux transporter [Clostridiales bacterium]